MKKKHIIALACVLALAVSLMSSFAYAVAPQIAGFDATRAVIPVGSFGYINKSGTYLYNSASDDSGYKYNFPIPVNTDVKVKGHDGAFYLVEAYVTGANAGTYTGYVQRSRVSPE